MNSSATDLARSLKGLAKKKTRSRPTPATPTSPLSLEADTAAAARPHTSDLAAQQPQRPPRVELVEPLPPPFCKVRLSVSFDGKLHVTSVVNASLSQRFMLQRDLGVLKGMPAIREKANKKLAYQQLTMQFQANMDSALSWRL
ncbi:hypothetical protein FCM35_KLT20310 [Carex littledalei]|uniref:Uncharacterized protein n=1 Tax=Carex littledalei TaxID=544730 RepID=A0A833VUK9_9POAL|nr:hypothetical protein FCM35_KLT20310 [Carex littledalei]